MKKFSLLLASRHRVELLNNLLTSIVYTTQDTNCIEVLIGIDDDDSKTQEIKNTFEEYYKDINLKFFSRTRSRWLHKDYINWIFKESTGKFVLVLNDDTKLTNKNWDYNSYNKLEEYLLDKPDGIVYGITKDNTGDKRCCCFPLISREACKVAGWVMPSERMNWGGDLDVKSLYCNPRINRYVRLPEIEVQHITHHNNSRPRDKISIEVEQSFKSSRGAGPNIFAYVDKIEKYIMNYKPAYKILVVYNICELSGKINYPHYLPAIQNILDQEFSSFKIAISGCLISEETKIKLKQTFGNKLVYNWIEEIIPLNTTFNHTVRKCFNVLGEFEAIVYVDSGVLLQNTKILQELWNRYETGKYSICTQVVSSDTGAKQWKLIVPQSQDFVMPIGKALNLHVQLFGKEIYHAFDRKILPDVFASDCSESIMTFMCAAINKKWVVCSTPPAHHKQGIDGPSVGFRGRRPLLYKTPKNINQICAAGANTGFGYEECKPVLKHDPKFYDEHENHKEPETLLYFIKNNCFFNDNEFYDTLPGYFEKDIKSDPVIIDNIITCLLKYEGGNHIHEAIDSVINQTFTNWKLIIIDQHSGKFNELKDERIIIKQGYNDQVIQGIYVVYLNENNLFYPNAFETLVQFYRENQNLTAVYASIDTVEVDNEVNCWTGEILATEKKGLSVGLPLRGEISWLQFAHKPEVIKCVTTNCNEESFIERIGELFPIYPIDVKIGMSRSFLK